MKSGWLERLISVVLDLFEAVLEEFNFRQFQEIFGSWKFRRISRKGILKLKIGPKFFERGEEVFDYHYNKQKRFLTLKHFYGVPMMIGDRWSTIFLKNVIFRFQLHLGLHRSPR